MNYGPTGPTGFTYVSNNISNIDTLDYNIYYNLTNNIYCKNILPIHILVFHKDEFIKQFKTIKNDINKPLSTQHLPLDLVNDKDVAKILIDNGAKISSNFRNKCIDIIELLIDNGYSLKELYLENDPVYTKLYELKMNNNELKKLQNLSLEGVLKHTMMKFI